MNANPQPSSVTLRDIARKLGVSHVTVSLAMRNASQISEARRKQVQALGRSMGYRPNPMATALGQMRSTGKAQPVKAEIAWINHWPQARDLHQFREFQLYWKGAKATARWYGYTLEEFACNDEFTLARLERVLLARNVRGILIPPQHYIPPTWSRFAWHRFSVVRFGHTILYPRVPVVTSDQTTNSIMALTKIRALGYPRVGFVTTQGVRTRFKAGFLMAQLDLKPDEQLPLLLLATGGNPGEDQPKLEWWLKKNKPDAILTELAAVPAMLKNAGYRVPKDIGLATLSIHDGNVDTGIDQNPEEIGNAAVEMLISLINSSHTGVPKICRELLIEGEWVNGSMLPPRTAPKGSKTRRNFKTPIEFIG
jgi:LacI family transcriptional regulator